MLQIQFVKLRVIPFHIDYNIFCLEYLHNSIRDTRITIFEYNLIILVYNYNLWTESNWNFDTIKRSVWLSQMLIGDISRVQSMNNPFFRENAYCDHTWQLDVHSKNFVRPSSSSSKLVGEKISTRFWESKGAGHNLPPLLSRDGQWTLLEISIEISEFGTPNRNCTSVMFDIVIK